MNWHATNGFLHPTPPFNFELSREWLKIVSEQDEDILFGNHSIARGTSVNRQAVLFRLKSVGTVENPRLKFLLLSENPIYENTRLIVLERISQFLGLYDNLSFFYCIGKNDTHFYPVLQRLYGYHPVKFLTVFENACWAVLQQNNTTEVARHLKRQLLHHFGTVIQMRQIRIHVFPEPEDLAFANYFDICNLLNDDLKAEALQHLGRAFSDVNESFLLQSPYQAVFEWLINIRGMSAWAAKYILLNGLGRTEHALLADKNLINSAGRCYGKLIYTGLATIAEQYGEWQGYWSRYLNIAA